MQTVYIYTYEVSKRKPVSFWGRHPLVSFYSLRGPALYTPLGGRNSNGHILSHRKAKAGGAGSPCLEPRSSLDTSVWFSKVRK